MVADRPVDPHLLAQVTEMSPAAMLALLAELAASYEAEDRGFVLVEVAGGYRFQSHPELTGYVERFVLEGQNARLSSAALETIAIVAYKQPISRAQIASIRGVNVDGVVRTLEQRGYIAEVARDPGPGQAVLFGTTDLFLERLGLASLEELPAGGRVRARGRRGRGARARPAHRSGRGRARRGDRRARVGTARGRRSGRDRRVRRSRCRRWPLIDLPTRLRSTRAIACRRCWPGPGWAAGGCART